MHRYKVKEGTHVEGERSYTKGQVVVSAQPLATLFKEKFEDLGPVADGTPSPPTPQAPKAQARRGGAGKQPLPAPAPKADEADEDDD